MAGWSRPGAAKPVEINALWYNALRLLEGWLNDEGLGDAAREIGAHAERCADSFNQRFWSKECNYLYDVVDGESGDDTAFRPNQIFAISLTHPVLAREHWETVLDAVRDKLLTPMGLRTLVAR